MTEGKHTNLSYWRSRRVTRVLLALIAMQACALAVLLVGFPPRDRGVGVLRETWAQMTVSYKVREPSGKVTVRKFNISDPAALESLRGELRTGDVQRSSTACMTLLSVKTGTGSLWGMEPYVPASVAITNARDRAVAWHIRHCEPFIDHLRELCVANERKRFPGATRYHVAVLGNLLPDDLPALPGRTAAEGPDGANGR